MARLLILEVECESDDDVSDLVYMLFGPYVECAKFGDSVIERTFTLHVEDMRKK